MCTLKSIICLQSLARLVNLMQVLILQDLVPGKRNSDLWYTFLKNFANII